MSFQKKHPGADGGDEVNISSKNNSGLARLSTIKEDSPEFGPISDSSDVLKHTISSGAPSKKKLHEYKFQLNLDSILAS